MPYNDGLTYKERGSNCALCTVAKLTNKNSARAVLQDLSTTLPGHGIGNLVDEHVANAFVLYGKNAHAYDRIQTTRDNGQDVLDQLVGIEKYVLNKGNFSGTAHFYDENKADPNGALTFMRNQRKGTEFAVYTSGEFFGYEAHWFYAEKTGSSSIIFTDYQTNIGNNLPFTSQNIFLAPEGEMYNTSEVPFVYVIAFLKPPNNGFNFCTIL